MTTVEPRSVGRPCLTCASPRRQQVEEAIVSGDMVSTIATAFSIDRSSIRRHRDRHMAWSAEAAREAGLTAGTIIERLSEQSERLREDAMEAFARGDNPAHARASAELRRTLATMHLIAGDNAESIAAIVHHQRIQLGALWALARKHPALAERLATELARVDQPVLAQEVRTQFLETSSKELKP